MTAPSTTAIMQIIVRHAEDDFFALMTAQGIEDAGAEVFSITHNQTTQRMPRFLVFAKYDPGKMTIAEIDACIEKRLFPGQDENTEEVQSRRPPMTDRFPTPLSPMELSNSERDAIRQNMTRRQVSGMSLVERWVKEAEDVDKYYAAREIEDARCDVLSNPLKCIYKRATQYIISCERDKANAEIEAISTIEYLSAYKVYCKIVTAAFPDLFKNWGKQSSIEDCRETGWLHGELSVPHTIHPDWSSDRIDAYMKEYVRAKNAKQSSNSMEPGLGGLK